MKNKEINWLQRICEAILSLASGTTTASQSDWNEADSTKASFIKNKPEIINIIRIEVSDITALTDEQLDALTPGSIVVKITGNQKHTYIVSYKGEGVGEGICISYNAAGYGETVSYDRTESGWAYNSTDVKTYGE